MVIKQITSSRIPPAPNSIKEGEWRFSLSSGKAGRLFHKFSSILHEFWSGEPLLVDGSNRMRPGIVIVTDGIDTGGFIGSKVTKTSAYTATDYDYTIYCDASGGSFTVALPEVASHSGRVYHIKKIDSSGNTVTADPDGSETIDDGATAILTTQYESITIQSDASEWWIL